MSTTPERRRLPREGVDPRSSLQHGLSSWRLVQAAWSVRLDDAREAQDSEQMAAAEAKLEECEREIARIEKLLQDAGQSK
jgi:hypothetical protein